MDNTLNASGFVIQPRLQFENLIDKILYQHFLDVANYQKSRNCERGQTIISINKLSLETGWPRGLIRGSVNRLVKLSYISITTLKQKKGTLVTITDYDLIQNIANYSKKNNQQDNQQDDQQGNQQDNQQERLEKSSESKVTGSEEISDNQQDDQQGNQQDNQQVNLTLTEYINSIININKTLKEYVADVSVKNKNLSSEEDIKTFVDFAERTNALPKGLPINILTTYFDCIRRTRRTCIISANILVNFIEKTNKYTVDQLHYALWTHCEKHSEKGEKYTLGILRNTDVHEAKRGLMKLNNKGVASIAGSRSYASAVGERPSSTSKEVERLEALAREKGLHGAIRDPNFDF
ncbi:hypothetical protein [Bacillus niameyensis]|uniref:hypothetical protein n=1 Tax=Bacillus niameyensis TaxID=1522308 RepID=UPI000784F56B|nr:hypothetical protein [Bacillus niameyensis]